jgi:ribosomal protein L27
MLGAVKILPYSLTDGVVKFDHKDGKHKRINIVV